MTGHSIQNQTTPWRPRRIVRFAVATTLALPLAAYLLFLAMVAWWPYPARIQMPAPPATWIADRNGIPLAAFVARDGQWRMPLSLEQITPHLINAIVATEDARFFEHAGVNWYAAAAAGWQDLKSLSLKRGASTITMQLHRLREPLRRDWLGKLEQAVRAAQIERRASKDQILVEYLNRAPFGGNLVGAGAASWRYFDRPCRDLSLGQAALLAGLPKNPNHYRPDRFPQRAFARRTHVLNRMLTCGMIDPTQYAEANREPLDASWRPLPQMARGNASADGALPVLLTLSRHDPSGSITTTLDAALQRQTFSALREQLDLLAPSGVTAVAAVVLDNPTGECLAAVSLCADDRSIDLTRCARSTGSVIKPLIYAAAFEAGVCTPASILRDSPAAWPGYAPDNYDHSFRGSITAADALAESRNIPALHLLSRLGVERTAAICGAAGLRTLARTPQRYGLSLAIGGAEATPLEIAEAFATLARGGRYLSSRFVAQQQSANSSSSASRCITESACYETIAAISEPRRTAAISREAARLRVAWKTGTSSGHRDAWCAAITPTHTVVVWMGDPTGRGARSLVGAEAAAPVALRLAAAVHISAATWPSEATASHASFDPPPSLPLPQRRQLTILSPTEGSEIVYNRDLPATSERVLLRAIVTASPDNTFAQSPKLWWFIDTQPVGLTQDDSQLWWPPAIGPHELRVIDEQGHSAQIRFRVR